MTATHLLPGMLFIGSVVVGMFALVQAREMRNRKPPAVQTSGTKKKSLEELVAELNAKYPPEADYEMKKTS